MTVTTLTLRKRSDLLDCLASGILSASHMQPWDMVALEVKVVALEVVLVEQDKLDELLIPLIFIRAKSKVNFYIRSISILIFFLWSYSTWGPKCSSF